MSDFSTASDKPKCGECKGSGRVSVPVENQGSSSAPHTIVREIICPCCGGSGRAK